MEEIITEMQQGFFDIIGNMKLLSNKRKYKELEQYIDEQYEILKKELAVYQTH